MLARWAAAAAAADSSMLINPAVRSVLCRAWSYAASQSLASGLSWNGAVRMAERSWSMRLVADVSGRLPNLASCSGVSAAW